MTFNKVILGCSPFTLGYQFGHRSRIYELDFSNNPEAIQEVIDKAYEMNVHNISLKLNEDLQKAINNSEKEGNNWSVFGLSNIDNLNDSLEVFSGYDTKTVIIDGEDLDNYLDTLDYDSIKNSLDTIRDAGYIPAVETRRPFKNIPLLTNSSLNDYFDTIMIPLNFYGYMMDCNFFDDENRNKFKQMVEKLNKTVIANRTLATGILSPKEAYDFLKNIDYIDGVCVGVAKKEEAEETFEIINNIKD